MNLAYFFDTETTGLPLFKEPSEHPSQPHIVQIGALLVDLDTRVVQSSIDLIVQPDGWEIPEEVAALHGITTERALEVGVPEDQALSMFMHLWRRASVRIGHNEPFDARIVRIGLMRHASPQEADVWKAGPAKCTQKIATPIMKLPPTEKMLAANMRGPKSANLREAYEYFVGKPLEDAHSAMADARGCMEVFFAATAPAPEPVAA
jgi:DNA polymerase-3 subunit epsilon